MTDSTRTRGGATADYTPLEPSVANIGAALDHAVDGLRAMFSCDASMTNREVVDLARLTFNHARDPDLVFPGLKSLVEMVNMLDRMRGAAVQDEQRDDVTSAPEESSVPLSITIRESGQLVSEHNFYDYPPDYEERALVALRMRKAIRQAHGIPRIYY